MADFADLEIGLNRRDGDQYTVELRASQPGNEADTRRSGVAQFDFVELRKQVNNIEAYGTLLYQGLFRDPEVLTTFSEACALAQSRAIPLQVRLLVGSTAPELHSLRWETLCDPRTGAPLFTSGQLLLSRYLGSSDWRPVRLRPRRDLTALVVVANPTDLADYDLAAIDAAAETSRALASLEGIPTACIPDVAAGTRATLAQLADCLRHNDFDIVYLIGHGKVHKGEPWLWLEDDSGKAAPTAGHELVTRIRELEQAPRLVILGSCQSAGDGVGEALTALGPRLVEAGVPAVVAMQGRVALDTLGRFMPVFFTELRKEGQIDQAMGLARGAVRELADHWMPALFMRLKGGRIWYVPGFGEGAEHFEQWESLAGFIAEGTCTPILGLGLLEPLWGSAREIAGRWAQKYDYPLSPRDQEDLARVAQYVETRHGPAYLRLTLRETLRDELMRRHGPLLTEELRQAKVWTVDKLAQAIDALGQARQQKDPFEPHRVLAQLRLPVYITANFDNLLAQALKAAGAEPQVRLCPWNPRVPKAKAQYDEAPTPERPLVYHLFGHLSEPFSLVITEDEYFAYLIGVTKNKDLIPAVVRAALTSTALLFLGFQTDDWNFRVLFRSLMDQEGSELGKLLYSHVAAQIVPEEGRLLDSKRARRYLEKYFESEKINLYWGSVEEFMKMLSQHLPQGAASGVPS